jgi:lipopolysaccharide transport system permease protein
MTKDFEYSIEPSGKNLYNWQELWQYRELFYFFTWRDVKVKYKETILGILWVVLQPVLTVLIFTLFVGHALKVPSEGLPYPVFAFSGLLLWTVFTASINNAGTSMISNAPIIKKIYFPRIIIPVSSMLVSLIDFVISFMAFALMVVVYEVDISFTSVLVFWPAAFLLMLVSTIGMSCWLAALNVKYRDFRFLVPFALQIGLFVTPVIYPTSLLENSWIGYVMAINPLYGAIMLFRAPFGIEVNGMELLISVASGLFIQFWGLTYFKKTEAYFADLA